MITLNAGEVFGHLTVVEFAGIRGNLRHWKVRCVCGTEKAVSGSNLKLGRVHSCGCQTGVKHGYHGTRTYTCWQNMLNRCRQAKLKAFKDYGGRGIKVCKRWQRFENFLADMGEVPDGHDIDRWDNEKGYNRNNCFWATPSTNNRHKRNTIWVTFDNQPMSLAHAAELSGISYWTLRSRFDRQGDVPDIFRKVGERHGNQYSRDGV